MQSEGKDVQLNLVIRAHHDQIWLFSKRRSASSSLEQPPTNQQIRTKEKTEKRFKNHKR